ncbi:MAG: HEAT repeat domain-containing protein [Planctomycetota bacterium]
MIKVMKLLICAGLLVAVSIGCSKSEESRIDKCISEIKDKMSNAGTRNAAAARLVGIGAPAVPRLIRELKNNDNVRIRYYSCVSLGKIGDSSALDAVTGALRDEAPEVRGGACEAIARLENEKAIPTLIEMLMDEQTVPREEAKKALANIVGNPKETEEDKDNAGVPSISPLIECFQNKNEFLRSEARVALEQIGPKAVDKLIDALKDEKGDVVVYVAKTLAAIGEKRALDSIMESAKRFEGAGNEKIHKSIRGAFDDLKQKLGS